MAIIKSRDPYDDAEEQLADVFASGAAAHDRYARVCAILHETIPTYNWVGIALSEGGHLTLCAQSGPQLTPTPAQVLSRGVGASALMQVAPVDVGDVHAVPDYCAILPSTRAEAAVAIRERSRVVGVLLVASDHRGAFGLADRDLLAMVAASLGR